MISSQLATGCSDQVFQDVPGFPFHWCFLTEFFHKTFHFERFSHFFPVGFITITVRLDDHDLAYYVVFLARILFQFRLCFIYTWDPAESVISFIEQIDTALPAAMAGYNVILTIPVLDQERLKDPQKLDRLFQSFKLLCVVEVFF